MCLQICAAGVGLVSTLSLAWLHRPADGETTCGDAVAAVPVVGSTGQWLVVIDGLGHGPAAALAAQRALAGVRAAATPAQTTADPVYLLQQLDSQLAGTRGAAVGLAWLQGGQLRYAAVGNTRLLRWRQGAVLRLPSRYGIVGDGSLAAQAAAAAPGENAAMTLDLLPGDWLLLFTDGLDERLHFDLLLPEWQRDPQRLCQHLMAAWRQPRDDAAVLVARVDA